MLFRKRKPPRYPERSRLPIIRRRLAMRYHMRHQFDTRDLAFLQTMVALTGSPLSDGNRVEILKNGVQIFQGSGFLCSPGEVELRPDGRKLRTRNVTLATGARMPELPGLTVDGRHVIASRPALALRQAPPPTVIAGGVPSGCAFAYLYRP